MTNLDDQSNKISSLSSERERSIKKKEKKKHKSKKDNINQLATTEPSSRKRSSDQLSPRKEAQEQEQRSSNQPETITHRHQSKRRKINPQSADVSSSTVDHQLPTLRHPEDGPLPSSSNTLDRADHRKEKKTKKKKEKSTRQVNPSPTSITTTIPEVKSNQIPPSLIPAGPTKDDLDRVLITKETREDFTSDSHLTESAQYSLIGLTCHEILHSKWLTLSQLNELATLFGLKFLKGKFNRIEKSTIQSMVEEFCKKNSLAKLELWDVRMSKKKHPWYTPGASEPTVGYETFQTLLTSISAKLEGRPIVSIWKYINRTYNPRARLGKWTDQEDQILKDSVLKHGSQWTRISELVGRAADDCKDRWRKYISVDETKNSGKWTKKEEECLIKLMAEAKSVNPKALKVDGLWNWVSQQMGGSRSSAQCRFKWVESLRTKAESAPNKPVWKHRDILILAQQLKKYGFQDEDDFNWRQIKFEGWMYWGSLSLFRRWKHLKKYIHKKKKKQGLIKHDQVLSNEEVLDAVLEIWGPKPDTFLDSAVRLSLPGMVAPTICSAEFVEESDNDQACDQSSKPEDLEDRKHFKDRKQRKHQNNTKDHEGISKHREGTKDRKHRKGTKDREHRKGSKDRKDTKDREGISHHRESTKDRKHSKDTKDSEGISQNREGTKDNKHREETKDREGTNQHRKDSKDRKHREDIKNLLKAKREQT